MFFRSFFFFFLVWFFARAVFDSCYVDEQVITNCFLKVFFFFGLNWVINCSSTYSNQKKKKNFFGSNRVITCSFTFSNRKKKKLLKNNWSLPAHVYPP